MLWRMINNLVASSTGEKFIVFVLDDELFAISSKQVAEVTHPLAVTPLPNAPEWLLGIANLRGEIISVADLQKILAKNSILTLQSEIRNLCVANSSRFIHGFYG